MLTRSTLPTLTSSDTFWWAVGIEDSFITTPSPRTGRTMDAYALTGHYDRWAEDIALMAQLGVRVVRYGIPWPRLQPAPDRWDWDWSERALDRLLDSGIAPIVDLVHYGVPDWLEGAFLHPEFPARMAEYAARIAERFRGRIALWTPLNEPRITAWHCGRTGVWPPYGRSWRGFVAVLLAACRGIIQTHDALRSVDPENVLVHIDAANRWLPPDPPNDPALTALTESRENLAFLALDLVSGRVTEAHPLWPWLLRYGASVAELEWFQAHSINLDVIGFNLYPMLSQKQFARTPAGNVRIRFPYGTAETIERVGEAYWERYRCPLFIGETAGRGRVTRRLAWLNESVEGVRRLRANGVPLIGYTWWPMFDLVAWSYRQSQAPLRNFLVPMGLWGLDPDTLDRTPTPLVDAFAQLVAGGAAVMGPIREGV